MNNLSFLDRFLTLWIFLAMVLGIAIGVLFPQFPIILDKYQWDSTNIFLAIGLIVMMYPPLAKVKYEKIPFVFRDLKILSLSLFLNWFVGPVLMFLLAFVFLSDKPDYFVGLVMIGIARCIAMVLVWNDLAKGDNEYVAGLVAFNSIFQIFFYSTYAYFFLTIVPGWIGWNSVEVSISILSIAKSVLVYLGVPFALGYVTRKILIQFFGYKWFESVYLPKISPLTLVALLFTIVIMFSYKGGIILQIPMDVFRIALPLVCYFAIMFFGTFALAKRFHTDYEKKVALAFTAAGNNFELGIAVSIAVFGVSSGASFAAVIGPLIEVPLLISFVSYALAQKKRELAL